MAVKHKSHQESKVKVMHPSTRGATSLSGSTVTKSRFHQPLYFLAWLVWTIIPFSWLEGVMWSNSQSVLTPYVGNCPFCTRSLFSNHSFKTQRCGKWSCFKKDYDLV